MSTIRFFSTTSAAQAASVPPSYVHRLIRLGVISPPRDDGGRWLLSQEDVEAIRARRATTALNANSNRQAA